MYLTLSSVSCAVDFFAGLLACVLVISFFHRGCVVFLVVVPTSACLPPCPAVECDVMQVNFEATANGHPKGANPLNNSDTKVGGCPRFLFGGRSKGKHVVVLGAFQKLICGLVREEIASPLLV